MTVSALPIVLEIDLDAKEEREMQRYRRGMHSVSENTCHCCGRKATKCFVAIDQRTGDAVTVAFAEEDGGEDTAYFAIGPVCRKAFGIPKTHVITAKQLFKRN